MKHEKTVIYFESKGKSYQIEYGYRHIAQREVLIEKNDIHAILYDIDSDELQVRIFENGECIKLFETLPSTNTKNPTKSQARELLTIALREIKKENNKPAKKSFNK